MFPSFTKHLHLNSNTPPSSCFSFNLRLIKDSKELETTAEMYLKPEHVQFTVDMPKGLPINVFDSGRFMKCSNIARIISVPVPHHY